MKKKLHYLRGNLQKLRKTVVFLSFITLCVSSLYAQDVTPNATINVKNESFVTVIESLRKQTGYEFIFNSNDVKGVQSITLNVKNTPIETILKQILVDSGLDYTINNRRIVIKQAPKKNTVIGKEKKITIKGKVLNSNKKSVEGATLIIEGTTNGAITDVFGGFELTTDVGRVINVSYTGMKDLNYVVSEAQDNLILSLEFDEMAVEDVVVTGIFKKAKESYTGAVSTISEKQLKAFRGRNLLSTLKNIDPTLNIIENNQQGSNPNNLPEIQMRGTSSLPTVETLKNETTNNRNTPLIIMDGFEVSLAKMIDLNDEDVSSITLLKDGSATAIYGSRGANGVIVIETKRPQAGKLRLSYNGSLNIEAPDLSDYNVLDARQKLELEKAAGLFDNENPRFDIELKERYSRIQEEIARGVDTYWLAKPLQTGVGHKHNIRLEGGGEDGFRYAASIQYNNIKGVMKGSDKQTFSGGVNLLYQHKNLTIRNNLEVSLNESNESSYGSFDQYVRLNPYWRDRDSKGNITKELESRNEFWNTAPENPMFNATLDVIDKTTYTNIINNFDIEWRPFDGFTARSRIGLSKGINNRDDFKPAGHTLFKDYSDAEIMRKGKYSYLSGKSFNYDWNITLSYSKQLNEKHTIYAGVDFNLAESNSSDYGFVVEGFPQANINYLSMALQYESGKKPSGSESTSRRLGLTGNLTYTYNSKYYVDFAYRVDGASQFGANKRYAPFYSAGLGWNLNKEKFMENIEWLNRLKIRGSYAVTGSVNFDAYQAVATYDYFMNERYRQWFGAYLKGIGNNDLEWQKTDKLNLGLELSVLNNRLQFTGDIYSNKTSNLLSEMYMPDRNGFASYTDNVGEVSNKGIELVLIGTILSNSNKNIYWNVSASIVNEKNEIVKISDALKAANREIEEQDGTNPNLMYREGNSLRTIYVVPSLGIDPSTGKELYIDRRGVVTSKWDARDKIACGVSEPKFRGNINSMFSYRDWSLNFSFGYRFGGEQYNATLIDRVENADMKYNVDSRVYSGRWRNPGERTFFKDVKDKTTTQMSSRFVQKENTLECQSLSLKYDFQKDWIKKYLGAQSLSLSFATDNLFRISTIKQERGISYPFSRRFSFSIYAIF